MDKEFYAHSLEGRPTEEWQPLDEHLASVAELAKKFAGEFGAREWGYLAGLWHDLGKYSEEFQRRLEGGKRVDHATAGAKHALKNLSDKNRARILSYVIAGHHSGLPDGKSNDDSCLTKRLNRNVPDYSAHPLRKDYTEPGNPSFEVSPERFAFQLSFYIRMVYSCLVDADFLDTEAFMDKERASWRKVYTVLETMNYKLSAALSVLEKEKPYRKINKERSMILQNCLSAAESAHGLFSLTVPTGGGKTLSSLAFAFKHALRHGMKRVIYVIPYTSIIEQNAAVFRDILGSPAVLEHHSNYDPRSDDKEEYQRSQLASENWDAPLIVTTNVQFFESLFSNRSSKCRRLHNIANSVVILDEAQMLPVSLLAPSLEVLRELTLSYKTSVLLCTATQPALASDTFINGLDPADVREIIPEPQKLYQSLKRVDVKQLGTITDNEIAERLTAYRQVLCVVNTRKHARILFEKLDAADHCYHLSALMCPVHRTIVLGKIKKALAEYNPCRVVSTQLIEAGVDIDFPVVFRAAAGIDSIAQAAGRCNREGLLPGNGEVFVFIPEDGLPPGHLRHTAEAAETVLHHHADPLSLESVFEYFQELYWKKGDRLDENGILTMLKEDEQRLNFPFKEIAQKFRMIKDNMGPIIVPWDEEAEVIIRNLAYAKHPGRFTRQLQRYTIQVPPNVISVLNASGSVEAIGEDGQFTVLRNMDIYRDDLGLCPEDPTFHEVENLIC